MTEETGKWLVFHIGCTECGYPSGIVGLFDNEDTANQVAEKCYDKHNWLNGGQNGFEVYPLPAENTIHEDYEGVSL